MAARVPPDPLVSPSSVSWWDSCLETPKCSKDPSSCISSGLERDVSVSFLHVSHYFLISHMALGGRGKETGPFGYLL